ncbi:CU044_2847 family protein [Streptomyces sp. NPDC001822]|uniref:CU044_2847 family protein n=1 Tax=Streptomyces sp. NPDC001822 TaxID=3364614 RepID=UPI00368E2F50
MTSVGDMQLGDGTSVRVELADGESGFDRVGRGPGGLARSSAETLQEALDHVRPALDTVANTVRELAHRPDTVSVEFGIKLAAEAGVVVAKAASEANFTVTLEWSGRTES